MDWKRFKDPTLIICSATFLLLLFTMLLYAKNNSQLHRTESRLDALYGGSPYTEDNQGQFDEALGLTKKHLEEGAFLEAYDLILLSSRLRPSDPRLLDIVLTFIEQAYETEDDEAIIFADDLSGRCESLIHFQLPTNVASARKRFSEVVSKALPSPTQSNASPYGEVSDFLVIAENQKVSIQVRSSAVDQARSILEEVTLEQMVREGVASSQKHATEVNKLKQRLDSAEQTCLNLLFDKAKIRATNWLTTTSDDIKACESVPDKDVPGVAKRIRETGDAGIGIAQELTPYARSGVSGAADLEKQVEKQIDVLRRTKLWLFNQQTLRRIRFLESRKDMPVEEKIKYLAEIREERLAPYVLRRFTMFWDKLFEELDEDKKVWAVKIRILRTKESS